MVIDGVNREGSLFVEDAELGEKGILPEGAGADELLGEAMFVIVVRDPVGEVLRVGLICPVGVEQEGVGMQGAGLKQVELLVVGCLMQ